MFILSFGQLPFKIMIDSEMRRWVGPHQLLALMMKTNWNQSHQKEASWILGSTQSLMPKEDTISGPPNIGESAQPVEQPLA